MDATTQQGWIKLFYQFRNWEWYGDPNMVSLFIHLLLRANFKPVRSKGAMYGRGVVVTSREELSRETGISERTIRTCLTRLKSTNEIAIETTKQGSVITITNYERYQYINNNSDQENDQQTDRQVTNDRPTTDQQVTNSIDSKNIINKYFVVANRAREEFLADFFKAENQATLEAICMGNNTDLPTLHRLAEAVVDEWQATEEPMHQDMTSAKRHLLSQIRIKLNVERREQTERERMAKPSRASEKSPRNVNDSWKDFKMPAE